MTSQPPADHPNPSREGVLPSDKPTTASASGEAAPQRRKSVLFRNRDFLWVWTGESISLLGSEISVLALPSLAVLAFGEGAMGVGLLVALQWLPFVVLAPVLGVFTDRMLRRTLMQVSNLARFVILGSLPFAWILDGLTIQHVYIVALLKGVFDVIYQLAYQAYLPQLVAREDLIDGNAKTQLSRSLAVVFGRSVGGGLVSLLGAARAIGVDALSYLISSLALSRVRTPEPEMSQAQRGVDAALVDFRSGVKMTFGNRLLRSLSLMAMCGNLAVSMVLAMVIVYSYQNLGFSAGQVGLALGVGGAPVLVGAILSRRLNEKFGMGRTLILTHALLVVAFLLLPLADTVPAVWTAFVVVVIAQGIASFGTPIANVGIMTLIQKATPPQAMGRVGGVALPFVWGANAAGPLLGAAIAAGLGVVVSFYAAAALAALAIVWIFVGSIQRLTDDVPEEMHVVV